MDPSVFTKTISQDKRKVLHKALHNIVQVRYPEMLCKLGKFADCIRLNLMGMGGSMQHVRQHFYVTYFHASYPHFKVACLTKQSCSVTAYVGRLPSMMSPLCLQVLKTVSQFRDKGRSRDSILLYGHGDGGGGPT